MAAPFSRRLGAAVRQLAPVASSSSTHIAAAEHAILDPIPVVDLVVEVRDARIPSTSTLEPLRNACCFHKQLIVLNKVNLADHSITELLRIIQARIKELKVGESSYTATILLAGIPNVGKSAIANSMHQIGRIGAAEKGKLKHTVISPHPGETKDISSYKIGSQPNLYVLDSPGILSPNIAPSDSALKLALTGAIKDYLIGKCELARYLLAILNLSEVYKRWEKLEDTLDVTFFSSSLEKHMVARDTSHRKKRQYPSDHTQGDLKEEKDIERLIDLQFIALQEAFRVPSESFDDRSQAIASKLLDLYRTGRVGRYTLDLAVS